MVSGIYNMLRVQRNDLGHPKELPPAVDREEAFARLQLFPGYYETAEKIRQVIGGKKV